MQVSGPLTLGQYGSMNVGPSGTLQFSSVAAETELFNGSVVNGKFVIDQPTDLYLNHGDISGTGQICVTAPQGVIINNHSNSFGGTIDQNISVVLNSGNLPFNKTDVTQSTINTTGSNSFIVSIGGDVNTSGGGQEGTITVNGVISGSSDVNFSPNSTGGGGNGTGAPALILGASNTYTGATFIAFNNSGVQLNVSNALPIGTDLFFGGPDGNAYSAGAYLDLHGNNQQIGSLSTATGGTKSQNYLITNMVLNTTSTLTVSGTTTPYEPFAGYIADLSTAIMALVKSGANTLVLTGPSNYSGGTTVAGGMLIINNSNLGQTAIGTGNLTVSGGTFGGSGNVGDPGYSHGVPTFSVSAGAALYVGVPASGATKNSNATLYVNGNLNIASSAAIDYDFGSGSASQLIEYNTLSLPNAGSVTVNLTNVNGLTGTLPIISWESGSLTGGTSSLTLGNQPSGDSYALSYDTLNSAIDLTITPTGTASVSLSGGTTSWGAVLATTPTTAVTIRNMSPSTTSTVTLDTDRTAGSIAFAASTNGEIILDNGGQGNKLTLGTTAAPPTVVVSSGSADIIASTHLGGNLTITLSSGTTLQLANMHEDTVGSSLTLVGNGELLLSGSSLYTGGTTVEGGTVVVENPYGLADGSNITVDSPGYFSAFVPGGFSAPSSASVAAVPEPGTLALLAAGMAIVAFRAMRREKQ